VNEHMLRRSAHLEVLAPPACDPYPGAKVRPAFPAHLLLSLHLRMFAQANVIARGYTRPVVISTCDATDKVSSSIGAYVVLNEDGWILTAWHIIDLLRQRQAQRDAYAAYLAQRKAIEDAADIPAPRKKRDIQRLGTDRNWVKSFSAWWSYDAVTVEAVSGIPEVDLAVAKLKPFDPAWVTTYPTLRNPDSEPLPGTSLCRLGFPFHTIEPIYDPIFDVFDLPQGSVPPPFFPMEGILTRNILIQRTANYPLALIETSSPGLRGQSGGPIFDTSGTVWGIQTQTNSLPLGFEPIVEVNGRKHVEHQFLNCGIGAHAVTVVGLLRELGIKHTLAA
jgi:hypothetical protein